MYKTESVIKTRHAEYAAGIADWARYGRAYRGGRAYAQGALIQHGRERGTDFNVRKQHAHSTDLCSFVTDTRTAYLTSESATITPSSMPVAGTEFMDNVNRAGDDIARFISLSFTVSAVYGTAWIGVDAPMLATARALTAADEQALGQRPYLSIHTPDAVPNWGLDERGNLAWLLAQQPSATRELRGTELAEVQSPPWLLWTSEEWIRLDADGREIGRGVNPIGVVPFVPMRFKRDPNSYLGISLLASIEPVNCAIVNVWSDFRELLRRQAFSILSLEINDALRQTAMSRADDGKTGGITSADVEIAVSPQTVLTHSGTAPVYVSPDASQGALYLSAIEALGNDALRMAGLLRGQAVGEKGTAAASGVSKAFDFLDTNQSLSSQAEECSDAMEAALWMASKWAGREQDFTVKFPRDFGVETAAEVIARFRDLMLAGLNSEALSAAYLEKIARAEFADMDPAGREMLLRNLAAEAAGAMSDDQAAPDGDNAVAAL